jgi:hypothetical protein
MYEEFDLISDNSKWPAGQIRPVQMLRIDLQLDSQDSAQQRINDYIEECIVRVGRKPDRTTGRRAAQDHTRLMSKPECQRLSWQRQYTGQRIQNRYEQAKQQAQAMGGCGAGKLGGGKIWVFFSVLSALMTYTRTRKMEAWEPILTKIPVLIMDNPFGRFHRSICSNPCLKSPKNIAPS